MRIGKVNWVNHAYNPIMSVDVQPNGYRFVTGGGDNYVCVWNLLPVISETYEEMGAEENNQQEKGESKHGQKRVSQRGLGDEEGKEDVEMREDEPDSYLSHASEDGLSPEERLRRDQRDADFEKDIKLMEGLFQNNESRSQRLLAVLENHSAPVNCVRWNSLGTMFASADDEGSIILWEYRGQTVMTAFQARMYEGGDKKEDAKSAFADYNSEQQEPQKKPQVKEDWKALKTWRGHSETVHDLAWSPDSLHFVSCSTDARICIWNVNEHAPVTILESKANGLSFDPFGKFIASQSSEDKKITIWRVQNYKNVTKESENSTFYQSQAMSQSLFRRLSWSSDGAFISTTGGRAGPTNIAPLISRSNWNLAAALSGHTKPITVSRINPTLYKEAAGNLSGFSVIALASPESTITVWKPQLKKPLCIMMDNFKMGITDLSWGFNGNILLAASTDGQVMCIHFQPGILGQACSETEKRLIIEGRYGKAILDEYVKNKRIQQTAQPTAMNLVQQNAAGPSGPKEEAPKQQVLTSNTGKKKIVPVMVQTFQRVNEKIDPTMNPFIGQQLKMDDQSAVSSAQAPIQVEKVTQEIERPAEKVQQPKAPTKKVIQPEVVKPIIIDPPQSVPQQVVQPSPKPASTTQITLPVVQKEAAKVAPQSKTKEKETKEVPQSQPVQEQSTGVNTQQVINHLERLLETSKETLARDPQQVTAQLASNARDDITISLPAQDIFSEEMRIIVMNSDHHNVFLKQAAIKVYNSSNHEIAGNTFSGACVVLATANSVFYSMYTTDSKLNIFSSRSTQLIKSGLILDGLCMLASNGKSGRLCTMTIKGTVSLFRVRDVQSLDSCTLEWKAELTEILRQRNSGEEKVYVDNILVGEDGSVLVFLTDKSRFEYSVNSKCWREISSSVELPQAPSDNYPITTSSGVQLNAGGETSHKALSADSLNMLIRQLEVQQVDQKNPPIDMMLPKISEFQEALEMYQRLGMKQEWMYAFRMLVTLLLHANDFAKLQLLMQGFTDEDQFNAGVFTKYSLGEQTWNQDASKGVVIRCGEGNIGPSIDRSEAFRSCVVPPLKSYFGAELAFTKVITNFVELLNREIQPENVIMK